MTKYILMALALGAFTGCDNGDTLSEQQTMQALTAIANASGSGFSAANGQAQGSSGQVSVNASADCLNGGSIQAGGQIQVNNSTQQFSYDLGLSFESCQVGNLTMNGNLDLGGSANTSQQQFSISLSGRVTFTGGISGTCVFNLNQSYDASSGRYTFNGRACGRTVAIEITTGG
jgi:hypothetical protein